MIGLVLAKRSLFLHFIIIIYLLLLLIDIFPDSVKN